MFLHWLAGMIFVFYFASLVVLLREVLRPGVLWFLRNLNDHNFHPIQDVRMTISIQYQEPMKNEKNVAIFTMFSRINAWEEGVYSRIYSTVLAIFFMDSWQYTCTCVIWNRHYFIILSQMILQPFQRHMRRFLMSNVCISITDTCCLVSLWLFYFTDNVWSQYNGGYTNTWLHCNPFVTWIPTLQPHSH